MMIKTHEGPFHITTVTAHEPYGVLSHWQLVCLFNSVFRLLAIETSKVHIRGPLWVREREIKFIGLFWDRGHRGPYRPYNLCNHNLYIGIIIFHHIDNPQSTGYSQSKKRTIKIINEKSEGPINLTNHWRKRLWISLHVDLKRLN